MLKPKYINILIFYVSKYIFFFIFLMFKYKDYRVLEINELKDFADWFLYLWLFLFLPIACSIIFGIPMYYIFKINNNIYMASLLSAVIVGEYFFYTNFASQLDLNNGIYNVVLSVVFLFLFFFKEISPLLQGKK
ncbi:hypothetical protein ACFOW1_01850 [Parasediminibacterium paludis]|uniref:VanZ like protein n=1 Tax=Parasediminibacterium paludis TaxID=908966 RepID=A0ABV8PTH1_9BACT